MREGGSTLASTKLQVVGLRFSLIAYNAAILYLSLVPKPAELVEKPIVGQVIAYYEGGIAHLVMTPCSPRYGTLIARA